MVDWKPQGTHQVTPHLVVKDAAAAIDFYVRALGAQEHFRMDMGGGIAHAELQFGDSLFYLADEWPGGSSASPQTLKGSSVVIHLYVEDVDGAFQRAVGAGASVVMPPMDMFWGDRYAQVRCPFGHVWSFAAHQEDVSPEEMERRGQEFMKQAAPPAPAKKPARKAARKAAARKPAKKATRKPAPKPVKKPAAKASRPARKAGKKKAARRARR